MALVSGSLLLSGVDPENPKGAPGSKYMSGCEAAAVPTHTMKTIFGHVLLKGRSVHVVSCNCTHPTFTADSVSLRHKVVNVTSFHDNQGMK